MTRMMWALAEIQSKGDSMLVSISKQSDVLGLMLRKAEEAEEASGRGLGQAAGRREEELGGCGAGAERCKEHFGA